MDEILKARALLAEKEAEEERKKEVIIEWKLTVKNRREQMEVEKVKRQLEWQLAKEQREKQVLFKKQAREEEKMRKAVEKQLLAT